MSLKIYRRHNPKKCKYTSQNENRCKCRIWVSGTMPDGRRVRKALKERDWTEASRQVLKWEAEGSEPKPLAGKTSIETWRDDFIKNAVAENLSPETLRKYRFLFTQLEAFARDEGIRFVIEFDLPLLTEFRATWEDAPLSSSKKLERLRSLFRFAVDRGWIEKNPTLGLKKPPGKT